ncbi:MAG: S41 family peptidase [Owenweeksia sp.]|nr:S41 family peptidase [Owenweeksia sp.]
MENPTENPVANFESLWQTVHDKYAYFALKNIDWDSVHAHYSPRVNPSMSSEELFSVLDSMLYDLRDGHVNLISPFNLSRNWEWYLRYPENFNYDVIQRHYLRDNYRIAGGMNYTIIDSIGYIYYGSFASSFSSENLNQILRYLKNTKALIVDVRHNGGGSLNQALVLSSALYKRRKGSVDKPGKRQALVRVISAMH